MHSAFEFNWRLMCSSDIFFLQSTTSDGRVLRGPVLTSHSLYCHTKRLTQQNRPFPLLYWVLDYLDEFLIWLFSGLLIGMQSRTDLSLTMCLADHSRFVCLWSRRCERERIFVSMFSLAWTRWRYDIDIEVITKKLTKTLLMLLPPAQLSIRLSAHPSTYFNFTTFLAVISKDEPFHCMRCIQQAVSVCSRK